MTDKPSKTDMENFGLPPTPNLLLGNETREEREYREAAVLDAVKRIFELTLSHFGERAGRRLWNDLAKRRPGRKRRSSNPSWDDELLEIYDIALANPLPGRQSTTRTVADFVCRSGGPKHAHSKEAVRKRVERLVRRRTDRERAL